MHDQGNKKNVKSNRSNKNQNLKLADKKVKVPVITYVQRFKGKYGINR